ncbi:MAG: thiol oxidoreductase [Calditrichaeota bacterium]|nr:MAG: thiol oxidoreductase [Calditrichota bacterium]
MKKKINLTLILGLAFLISCDSDSDEKVSETDPRYFSGGETTVFNTSSQAFGTPSPNLESERLDKHFDGDLAFEVSFVSAPAEINSGLGPIFNNTSCVNCHPSDGRGKPPEFSGKTMETMFFKISVPGVDEKTKGAKAVPNFGTQLSNHSIFGIEPEANSVVDYSEEIFTLPDGEVYKLRTPSYTIENPYLELPPDVLISPRVAPPVFGRGLLEAIPEATLLEFADEDDSDGDGISGKANYVWNPETEKTELGRFGLKANNPTLRVQNAGAYFDDMGVTNPIFTKENSYGQSQYDELNDDPEISEEILDQVTFYVQTLGVPARRNLDDKKVKRGEQLFTKAKCSSCHIPTMQTGTLDGVPEVSNQKIYPYTDLLLHDMGEGLADGRTDFLANGNEWKTPPLWGIGLTEVVNGHTFFLHDGRARNLLEAIMWHDGEAKDSKEFFSNLPKDDREAIIAFLNSL